MTAAERLEELRDLPRVTAEDRERYKRWEQEARAELAEVEPEHSQIERAYDRHRIGDWVDFRPHRTAIDHADAIRRDVWRNHWRSLPDYDGPPMRAPSGVEFEQLRDGTLRVEAWRAHKKDHGWFRGANSPEGMADPLLVFGGITHGPIEAEYVAPSSGRNDNHITIMPLYARPSEGGRGWCPKLAGVGE